MARDPLRGALFENMVILGLIKSRWNQGKQHRLFFYRDSNQNEIDAIFQFGHQLVPIDIKSAQNFHPSFLKGIEHLKGIAPERIINPHILYDGKETKILPYTQAYQCLDLD